MKLVTLLSLLIVAGFTSSHAATHTITFPGFSYSPNTLQVAVGDVIEWQGDFATHPLTSDQIPVGAAAFSKSDGNTFAYTVTVAGNYSYYCMAHGGPGGQGMSGSFTAVDAGVDDIDVAALLQIQAYPNPALATFTLSFHLEQTANVRVGIYDMNGKQYAETTTPCGSGDNVVSLNVASLPMGTYYYRLQTSEATLTRKFVISR